MGCRIPFNRRKPAAVPQEAAQYSVDHSARPRLPHRTGEIHPFVDRRVARYRTEIEQLIKRKPQNLCHRIGERMTGIGRDAVIQRQAAFEHPIKEGGAKSRITHRQPRFGKRGVEGKLGISAAFDAQKRLCRDLAG